MTTFDTGGLVAAPAFISELKNAAFVSDEGFPVPSNPPFYGEDGNLYYVNDGNGDFSLYDVAAGTVAATKTAADLVADATAAGVVPFSGAWVGPHTSGVTNIPGTPYFIAFIQSDGGGGVRRGAGWYKVNSLGALQFMGGFAGGTDGSNAQFIPKYFRGVYGSGHILSNSYAGSNNSIPYAYPVLVAIAGENTSKIVAVPSINEVLATTPLIDNVPWLNRLANMGAAGFDNILETTTVPGSTTQVSRAFVLPRLNGSAAMSLMFYTSEVQQYAAGTATANPYLVTHSPSYPNGFVSTIDVTLSVDVAQSYGFIASLGSITPSINGSITTPAGAPAFPFDDDTDDYDGTSGLATENYYCNPTIYPYDPDDTSQPWLLFFPRIYSAAGDRDKLGVRVCAWYPDTQQIVSLDFAKGQVFTIGSDTDAGTRIVAATIAWDRSTGEIVAAMRGNNTGLDQIVFSTFGSFTPVLVSDAGTGAGANVPEELRLRGWAYEQDGHEFYVLRLGQQGTFIYDRTTQQWSQWKTGSDANWDAAVGRTWNNYVVAGALEDSYLWTISPDNPLDKVGVVGGDIAITRTVTGLVPVRGRDRVACNAVRITASVGSPDLTGATLSLRFSDDNGQTFSNYITVTLSSTDTYQDLSFRSLGAMRAPGRLFEVTDAGGTTRIDDAIVETDDGA